MPVRGGVAVVVDALGDAMFGWSQLREGWLKSAFNIGQRFVAFDDLLRLTDLPQ